MELGSTRARQGLPCRAARNSVWTQVRDRREPHDRCGRSVRSPGLRDRRLWNHQLCGTQFPRPYSRQHRAGSYSRRRWRGADLRTLLRAAHPKLLADAIGLPAINMGVAGAGPEFFLTRCDLIECMIRARFVILQVNVGNQPEQLHGMNAADCRPARFAGTGATFRSGPFSRSCWPAAIPPWPRCRPARVRRRSAIARIGGRRGRWWPSPRGMDRLQPRASAPHRGARRPSLVLQAEPC